MQPPPHAPHAGSLPAAHFHADSGAVRFWVHDATGHAVGAIIRTQILHHRFQADIAGTDALDVYTQHRAEIGAAVARRIAAGSIEPVLLREADLAPGVTSGP